jgi:DNA-binding NarL/FixJ family response regulator
VSENDQITVMVVDDHPMWREGVARDLTEAGLLVVATASTGTEALARAAAVRPRVVVLDLQIPAPTGAEVTARLVEDDPTVRVLILSASGEQEDVLEAVKAGATGYLVKSASRAELVAAVGRVAEGDTVFTPGLAGLVLGEYRRLSDAPATSADPDTPRLTERETEVLRLVARGLSNAEIAAELVVSENTVKTHVARTLAKLGLRDRVQAVVLAYETGLVQPGELPGANGTAV